MKYNRKTAGFTLIELMIVVAIIAIIASVAIPRLMAARLSANESAAISTLRSLSSAQAQLQSSSAIDSDGDGGGEYGYFGELAGTDPVRVFNPLPAPGAAALGAVNQDELNPAVLSTAFGNVVADGNGDGVVTRSGYCFKIFLPGPTGGGGATPGIAELSTGGAAGVLPDSNNCEILWNCYAWPISAGQTGNRCFFINQEGDLLQFLNRPIAGQAPYDGIAVAGQIPIFDAAYSSVVQALDMSQPLGINGVVSNDGNLWTPVQ